MMRGRLPKTKLVASLFFVLGCSFLPACAAGRAMTVSGRVTRRLEDGGGCDGYTESASVSTQAALQSAIDGSSSICIEITANIDLVGYHDFNDSGVDDTALDIATGKNLRLWSADGAVLNGQGSTRILVVEEGSVVKLEGLTFENGYSSGYDEVSPDRAAASVRRADSPSLTFPRSLRCTLPGLQWAGYGGAILNDGDITITSCAFNNNSAEYGGAIDTVGDLTITSSEFNGNTAWSGGAIENYHGDLTITSSEFNGNTASGSGVSPDRAAAQRPPRRLGLAHVSSVVVLHAVGPTDQW